MEGGRVRIREVEVLLEAGWWGEGACVCVHACVKREKEGLYKNEENCRRSHS